MSIAKNTVQIKYGDNLIKKLREENKNMKEKLSDQSDPNGGDL